MSYDLGKKAINEALKQGASYADARIGEMFDENLTVRKEFQKKSLYCVQEALESGLSPTAHGALPALST